VIGLTALATNLGTEIMTYSMVQNAIVDPMQADHATRILESLPAVVTNIMFLVGVVLGIPLTAAALWRSRAVPRIAAALLVAFLAVDLTDQSTGIGAIGAIAHVLAFIAASWIAVTVIRTPRLQRRPGSDRTSGQP
jgi:membrane associated rhomboid family serine protease